MILENNLQEQRSNGAVKEKTQYVLTFGVIAAMLWVAQFPTLVIFFFGIFAYFLWKTFSKPARQGIREVFEFYLAANEILRDDERHWFGFELQEVIYRGEHILKTMNGAPPLVYFSLGALYNKSGNHAAAVEHLSYIHEDDHSDESTYIHPTSDLRNYVRVLRKIEREPSEAPQMSAAVRSLERSRKNKAGAILDESRSMLTDAESKELLENTSAHGGKAGSQDSVTGGHIFDKGSSSDGRLLGSDEPQDSKGNGTREDFDRENDIHTNRKPITEVLHDIYDKNIQ